MEIKEILQIALIALVAILSYKDLSPSASSTGATSTFAPDDVKMYYYLMLVGMVLQLLIFAKVIKIKSSDKLLAMLPVILMLGGAAFVFFNLNLYTVSSTATAAEQTAHDSSKSMTQIMVLAVALISLYSLFTQQQSSALSL